MKKFVVSYIQYMNGELKMKIVHADSDLKACLQIMEYHGWDLDDYPLEDMDMLKNFCINGDCMINAIEI